jgi:chromate transport protein ChrA
MARAAARGLLVPAMLVSLLLAALPALVGVLSIRAARKSTERRWPRPGLIVLGLAGFVFWAGFLAGPAIVLLAGLLPGKR